MKRLLTTAALAALLIPGAAFAAEATGIVQAWDSGKRMLTLKIGLTEPFSQLGCSFEPNIGVPATLAAGRSVDITYAGPGAGAPGGAANMANKCSQLSLK